MPVDPEYELTQEERAQLVTYGIQGFTVIRKIMEGEVSKFNVALLNCKTTEHDEILAAHNLAKAAAQFCVQVINRVNREINEYQTSELIKKEQTLDDPFQVGDLIDGNL